MGVGRCILRVMSLSFTWRNMWVLKRGFEECCFGCLASRMRNWFFVLFFSLSLFICCFHDFSRRPAWRKLLCHCCPW